MSIETIHLAELQTICKEYWNKVARLEGDKYDLEIVEQFKNFEVKSDTRTSFYIYIFLVYFFFIWKFQTYLNLIYISLKN